jgi:predicted esterase
MNIMRRTFAAVGALSVGLAVAAGLGYGSAALAQPPAANPAANAAPRGPLNRAPDPRVEQRTYHFADTDEDLAYALFVSSKVSKNEKAPLIVALHGLGGDGNSLLRGPALDLAEEGGYILVGPLGYNVQGWFGSPVIVMGGRRGGPPAPSAGPDPETLAQLSEKDVLNVIGMIRDEFTVDPDRTYLMGHSMGGAGTLFLGQKYAGDWAAVAAIAPAAFMMQRDSMTILQPMKDAGVPVMIVQGGADTVVPPENTRAWVDSLEAMDMEHIYVELPEGDHGTVINDGMPGIFDFFAAHRK